MLENKDYCDYDTCVALKELGFDSLVDWYFKEDKSIASSLARYRNTYIPRISLYEAQKWLMEEKGIYIEVLYQPATWTCKIYNLKNREYIKGYTFFVSYEEALSEGIKKAVKLLKEEK